MKKRSEDVQGRALEILETLKKVKGQARVQALKELRQVNSGGEWWCCFAFFAVGAVH